MRDLLNQNIKDVIGRYPAVATVLEEYRIACTVCNAGSCMLKDIVEIHALSESDETALFEKIAVIVFPGRSVEIPRLPRKTTGTGKKLSPPLQMLVDEHAHILKVVGAIPAITESLRETLADKKETIRKTIDFIRNYADRFHHAKEEDLLFKQFGDSMDVIATMLREHETGRNHVREVINGLEADDAGRIAENFRQYGELLQEHIRKENEILYPWIDRNLSDSQVGRIYSKSLEIGNEFGKRAAQYIAFADFIVKQYS